MSTQAQRTTNGRDLTVAVVEGSDECVYRVTDGQGGIAIILHNDGGSFGYCCNCRHGECIHVGAVIDFCNEKAAMALQGQDGGLVAA